MITYEDIKKAHDTIIENWEESGKNVIIECSKITPFNDTLDNFLNYCTCCGGNWGGMLLTGVKKLWPNVYDSIPNDMGVSAWSCICSVLILCSVDTKD